MPPIRRQMYHNRAQPYPTPERRPAPRRLSIMSEASLLSSIRRRGSTSSSRRSSISSRRTLGAATPLVVKRAGNKRGGDHNDRATMTSQTSKHKKERKVSDAKIYRDALSFNRGQLKVIRQITLRAKVKNVPGTFYADDNQFDLRLFVPKRIKTIEGIMFNGVAINNTNINVGTNIVTGTIGANLPTFQPVIVDDIHATFRLKNVSQHKTIVEMFFFYGLGSQTTAEVPPWNAYDNAVLNEWRGLTAGIMAHNTMDTTMLESSQFNKLFHTERVVFKMEPGEEGFYKKQGPKKYVMHGKDHVANTDYAADASDDAAWLSYAHKGNGCQVMFRVTNDLTLVNATGGSDNFNSGVKGGVEHPIHRAPVAATAEAQLPFGAVVVEMVEHFTLAAPDKEIDSLYSTPFRYVSRQRLDYTGSKVDVQVDADNSATIPATPA